VRHRIARIALLLLLVPLLCAFDPFRGSNGNVEEGNAKLGAGKIKEALQYYERAAKELPDEPGVQYNLGVAHFQLGQFEQARQALEKATAASDRELKAKAYYNLGNTQLELKRHKEAVAAYTRSLQLNPGHGPSKWNLELALRRQQEEEKKKKKEEEEKKKQQKKDQQKDQKKDQQQDQQGKDQQQGKNQQQKKEQDQKKDQQHGKKKQEQKQDPRQGKKQQPKPKPDDQEREAVLDALDRNDKNLQRQRARQVMGRGLPRPVKDW